MTQVFIDDRIALDESANIRYTKDGYMVVAPRVARTGIQNYSGRELGDEAKGKPVVRVYRPESTVFAKDYLTSLAYKPITDDHPKESVTADNWSKYAKGVAGGEVLRDGDYIRIPMTITDANTIKKVKDGKRELSVGYMADMDFTPGTTPGGEQYDAIQTSNQANHIAIVSQARGGSSLRLGDKAMEGRMAKFIVDGINLEMEDTTGAVVTGAIKRITDELTTAKANVVKLTTDLDTATKAVQTKDGEITVLNKKVEDGKLKPEQIDKMVTDRLGVIGKARAMMGDGFSADGKSDMDIKRAVVGKYLGDDAVVKAMADASVDGAFLAATKDVKDSASGTAVDYRGFNDALGGNNRPGYANTSQGVADKAYDERSKAEANAWKNPPGNLVAATPIN